jgi:hypothetical protein
MPPGTPSTDLALAFKNGYTFKDDKAKYKVKVLELAKLTLPTGKLFAADPLTFHKVVPFERSLKKGTYPVFVSIANIKYAAKKKGYDQERLGAAMVRIKAGAVAKWVNATKKGQKLKALEDDAAFGYGVDAGTGCFADVVAAEALEYLNDVEVANDNWEGYLLGKISDSLGAPAWGASRITDPKTKANVVVFPSGWGDGVYASFWGLSKTGAPLCLVTDFGVYP